MLHQAGLSPQKKKLSPQKIFFFAAEERRLAATGAPLARLCAPECQRKSTEIVGAEVVKTATTSPLRALLSQCLPFCHFPTEHPLCRQSCGPLGIPFALLAVNNRIKLKTLLTLMKLTPLADRVIIKPAPAETKTVGGIIIPDTAKEKPLQGEVLAAGQGTKDEEMILKAGDRVLYGKYAGTEVEFDGEKLLIMRQSDVLAIVTP